MGGTAYIKYKYVYENNIRNEQNIDDKAIKFSPQNLKTEITKSLFCTVADNV